MADEQSFILKMKLDHAGQEMEALRVVEEQTSIYRHDMRHHLCMISSLLSAGRTEQATEYIRAMVSQIESIVPQRYCENDTVNLLLGFMPAMVIGFFLAGPIKSFLFNAETVVITWALGGIAILLYVRHSMKTGQGRRHHGIELEEMNWKQALTVGFMQCIAMCPGTSRSLMTMLGGLFAGLSMAAAVEFSFLLGLITLSAATVYDFMKYGENMVTEIGWGPMLAGTFMSWLSAIIAVKWMVNYLKKHGLSLFGWYRIAAALVMLVLILNGLTI
jgi:undecaprenyl-diphosphatase UppP